MEAEQKLLLQKQEVQKDALAVSVVKFYIYIIDIYIINKNEY